MVNEHTAKAFDTDLQGLTRLVAEMGGLAEKQIADSVDLIVHFHGHHNYVENVLDRYQLPDQLTQIPIIFNTLNYSCLEMSASQLPFLQVTMWS